MASLESGKRTRPCDACRRRKSRCVTEDASSSCVLCIFHNQECQYREAPAPRKRKLSVEASSNGTAMQPKRSRPIKTKPGTGIEEYDSYPGSLLRRTLGLQNLHHSSWLGPNTIPDVYDMAIRASDSANGKPDRSMIVRFVDPNNGFRIVPDSIKSHYDEERSLIDEIETTVEPHGTDLVQMYFRIIHPSFPILHREVFLEKYARSYREFSPPLLAMVYLLACGYWGFSESLMGKRRPDMQRLQQLALKGLHSALQKPKLSTIQALLLLSQHSGDEGDSAVETIKSRLTVQLVDVAYTLGLHLDASLWDIPDWEISLRRRLAWAIIVQEKWTAFFSGRPSLIQLLEWDVVPLQLDDFPETTENEEQGSSEVEKGRLVFVQLASLTVILSEAMSYLFSPRAVHSLNALTGDLPSLLEYIKPLQITLKDWFSSLPESLKMDTVASMKLSSVGYLRLAYLTVETCLHRHLIRMISTSTDTGLLGICRNAAEERFMNSVDFLQRLQAQHLAAFWYFTSSRSCALIFSFGQTLAGTETDPDRATSINQKLRELKWTLKVNSEAGATFMKQALALLDTSIRLLPADQANISTQASPEFLPFEKQGGTTEKLDQRNVIPIDPTGSSPTITGDADLYHFEYELFGDFNPGTNDYLFHGLEHI